MPSQSFKIDSSIWTSKLPPFSDPSMRHPAVFQLACFMCTISVIPIPSTVSILHLFSRAVFFQVFIFCRAHLKDILTVALLCTIIFLMMASLFQKNMRTSIPFIRRGYNYELDHMNLNHGVQLLHGADVESMGDVRLAHFLQAHLHNVRKQGKGATQSYSGHHLRI